MSLQQNQEININFFDDPSLQLEIIGQDDNFSEQISLFNFDTTQESPEEKPNTNTQNFSQVYSDVSIPYQVNMKSENQVEHQDDSKNPKEPENEDEDKHNHDTQVRKKKRIQKFFDHVKGPRNSKGKKNSYQNKVNSFWTNNFLPFAKKPHFEFIEKKMGPKFIETNQKLKEIKEKKGITKYDFVTLYKYPEMDSMWKEFFRNNVLYRELMLSRTKPEYRVIYIQFLPSLEEAFVTKKFVRINKVDPRDSSSKNERKRSEYVFVEHNVLNGDMINN